MKDACAAGLQQPDPLTACQLAIQVLEVGQNVTYAAFMWDRKNGCREILHGCISLV